MAGTIGFTLKNASGVSMGATVAYNSTTDTATLTPSSALAYNTTCTATVSAALDTAVDPMPAPVSSSFTTAQKSQPVRLANSAQSSNQPSSPTVHPGSIQGVTSAPSAKLKPNVQVNQEVAVLLSLVTDNPIGILPETLLNTLAQDWLRLMQKRS